MRIDSGSPYIAFDMDLARELGLTPPFRRRTPGRGIGGGEVELMFPDDGAVQILLADYTTEYYLWSPLIGFIDDPAAKKKPQETALLGWTGFHQLFHVDYPDGPPPMIDIKPKPTFKGRRGTGKVPPDIWTTSS